MRRNQNPQSCNVAPSGFNGFKVLWAAFTGAGIVKASDPESEWLETEMKLGTIRNALRVTGDSE